VNKELRPDLLGLDKVSLWSKRPQSDDLPNYPIAGDLDWGKTSVACLTKQAGCSRARGDTERRSRDGAAQKRATIYRTTE
jgi:hypothetical protein